MKRIMIDAAKCDGCKNCSIACMNAHRTDTEDKDIRTLDLTDPSHESRNFIKTNGQKQYKPIFCRHCDTPKCVESCMSGALKKDPVTGFVTYDKERCAQCYMCVMNCPFGVLRPDRVSQSYIVKCDFCKDAGGEPNCVKACPKKAIWVKE